MEVSLAIRGRVTLQRFMTPTAEDAGGQDAAFLGESISLAAAGGDERGHTGIRMSPSRGGARGSGVGSQRDPGLSVGGNTRARTHTHTHTQIISFQEVTP